MTSPVIPYLNFQEHADAGGTLRRWHDWLLDNRGARSALRRARSLDDVWLEEAYSRLRLPLLNRFRFRDEALARAALAVAELDGASDVPFAARAAMASRRGRSAVSVDRMRLTMGAEDPDEFLRLVRGMLSMIEEPCDPGNVADLVMAWHSPISRAHARRRIMLTYYEHNPETASVA